MVNFVAMNPTRGRELRHHALIASIVSGTVALLEVELPSAMHQSRLKALLVLVAFGLTFVVIYGIDRGLESIREHKRTTLSIAGRVHGYWRDIIFDDSGKQPLGGSIILIKGSGDEFIIDGWSYRRDEKGEPTEWGDWHANGVEQDGNKIVFYYRGHEIGSNAEDVGVGLYRFTFHPRDAPERFDGAFFGTGLKEFRLRAVEAQLLSKSDLPLTYHPNKEERMQLVLKHLDPILKSRVTPT
jgi:hypothetical protein